MVEHYDKKDSVEHARKARALLEKPVSKLFPEKYIGPKDIELFKKAGFSFPKDIAFISQTLFLTRKWGESHKKINLYNLIRLHALYNVSFRENGNTLDPVTRKVLDDFLKVVSVYLKNPDSRLDENDHESPMHEDESYMRYHGKYEKERQELRHAYLHMQTPAEKMEVLTRALNIIHSGGNPEGFLMFGHGFLGWGYPSGNL